jgi:hypothetical protein
MRTFPLNRRAASLTAFPIAASTLLCIAVLAGPAHAAEQDYTVHFSTLWGGSLVDQIRDLAADDAGNVYVTGGSASADLPTQPNESGFVFDSSHNGDWDVFVAKLDTPASCADPNGDRRPTATDGLLILGAAVGAHACDPCLCDLDGSGAVRASDALAELRVSVGSPLTLACTACP